MSTAGRQSATTPRPQSPHRDLVPDALLGPAALLVGALIAVGVLWREHTKQDAKRDAQLDEAIAGWRAQTTATDRLANATEIRNRRESDRVRKEDRP